MEEVGSMADNHGSPTALSAGAAARPEGGPAGPAALPRPPEAAASAPGWTGAAIAALAVGAALTLVSLVLLGAGGTALWADLTKRDAGYLTTDVQEFSSSGSALATEPTDLGSPWTGWLYSPALLDEVRIRVTPVSPGQELFVGIGPSADVDRYLAGVSHTHISDFWTNRVEFVDGGAPGSPPTTQRFWVASDTGPGTQTVEWEPADGSWTVVVMNADGQPGIGVVRTDLGARIPAVVWIALGVLAGGAVLLAGGVLLISSAVRRQRTGRARTARA
jgi:hypothetical protein